MPTNSVDGNHRRVKQRARNIFTWSRLLYPQPFRNDRTCQGSIPPNRDALRLLYLCRGDLMVLSHLASSRLVLGLTSLGRERPGRDSGLLTYPRSGDLQLRKRQ